MVKGLRALLVLSIVAMAFLVAAQAASMLDFYLTPAPSPGSTAPSGAPDAVLGAIAGLTGVIGLNLVAASGLVGLILAVQARSRAWTISIVLAGLATTGALIGAAWILLSSAANPFDPMLLTILVPIATGAFAWRTGRGRQALTDAAGSG